MNTSDEIDQAYSRLMAQKYALECITATVLNFMPKADAQAWLAEFKAKSHQVSVPDGAGVDDIRATRIVRDGVQLIDEFAEKVRKRLG